MAKVKLSLNAFAALGVFLAAVGIYGVVSYASSQRRREIGIRMALGATPRNVFSSMLRGGLVLALAGVSLGLFGSYVLTRVLQVLLVGTSTTDATVFGGASLVLGTVLAVAIYVPARRAARTDPSVTLRA